MATTIFLSLMALLVIIIVKKETELKDKSYTQTKKATDKCDVNKTIKETKNNNIKTNISTNEWQVIYKHGFSFNDMYEPNPYYNPNKKDSKKLKRTKEYDIWQTNMLCKMEQLKIKSLEDMNVDPNKPMKIEVEFTLVKGSDTDNPIKSFMDTLVEYYELQDDNNFYVINASRDFSWAASKEYGKIKFRITNIEKDHKEQITEVKVIREKIEVPKTVIKEVEVVKYVDNKNSYHYEKELSRLTIENERKEVKINKLKKQLETASKEIIEVPKIITKEVVKEVEVIREVDKGDNRYKMLYEKYKTAYEALKNKVDESKDIQIDYSNQSKFVQTDAYKQQLERIKQMKKSY